MEIGTRARRTTKIEWTDTTWNPIVGCYQISSGCKNCYAKTIHHIRINNSHQPKYIKPFEEVLTWDYELQTPYQWKEVKRVFVCSMSDLFNKDVPTEFIHKVFDVMNATPHYYQILTKRSERLKELAPELNWTPNIWAGVTVESGEFLSRIDDLRQVQASIRFISFEPLIGELGNVNLQGIDWAIVGGESGRSLKSLRQIDKDWVDLLRDQCAEEGVAFFFKQWGIAEFNPDQSDPSIRQSTKGLSNSEGKLESQKSKSGSQLDGISYKEFPEFPKHYPDEELKEIADNLEATLRDAVKSFTQSWVTIGQSLSQIRDKIESLGHGKLYWQTYFSVDSFQEYCRNRLSMSRETATQMRQGFELIQSLRPEVLEGDVKKIPSYTKLRALGPFSERIVRDPDKYSKLIDHSFGETSRKDLEREVRETFPKRKKAKKPTGLNTKKMTYEVAVQESKWDEYVSLIKTDLSPRIGDRADQLDSILAALRNLLQSNNR